MDDHAESSAEPTTVVIFGASGDLTRRKLIPALFNLYRKGRLPANTRIVGFARRPWTDDRAGSTAPLPFPDPFDELFPLR